MHAPCYELLSTNESLYFLLSGQLLYIYISHQIFEKKVSEVTFHEQSVIHFLLFLNKWLVLARRGSLLGGKAGLNSRPSPLPILHFFHFCMRIFNPFISFLVSPYTDIRAHRCIRVSRTQSQQGRIST